MKTEDSRGHPFLRDPRWNEGLRPPEGVAAFCDLAYGPHPAQRLDVYRPETAGERLPAVLHVHGGAWVFGDKELYRLYCMNLAARGFAVVNFSYRLAPADRYPAQLEDAALAGAWVLAHGAEYGMEPSRIFGTGDSSGAQLLGLLAAFQADGTLREHCRVPADRLPEFAAVALHCGVYRFGDDRRADALLKVLRRDVLPDGGTAGELAALDLCRHVTPGFPPVYLTTACGDFLRFQAPVLAQALTACRVPFLYRYFEGDASRLGHAFSGDLRLPESVRCMEEMCGFFREYIPTADE